MEGQTQSTNLPLDVNLKSAHVAHDEALGAAQQNARGLQGLKII